MYSCLAYGVVLYEHAPLAVHLAAGGLPVKGGEYGQTVLVYEGVERIPPESEVCLTPVYPDNTPPHQPPPKVHPSLEPKPPSSLAKLNKEYHLC